jgi:hypothetical protein
MKTVLSAAVAEPPAPCAAPAAQTAASTALAACWERMRVHALRTLVVMVALCLGIGLLLSALGGRLHSGHFIYSFCIGSACTLLVQGMRLLQAFINDLWRARRGLPVDTAGFERGWRGVWPATLLGVALGTPLGLALADQLTGNRTASLFSGSNDARVTLAMTVLGTVVTVFALSTLERLATARAEAEAARRQAAENQLRLLQSQLEPHMLFNTLANLRVLIEMDPVQAQAMLDRLIGFLRATLNASRTPRHALATEFERIGDYLALMAVRMGPRLAVELDLPADLRDVPVPPLVLQPLVENGIQHGLEPKVGGGRIRVSARRDTTAKGALLVLEVRDTGVGPDSPNAQHGTGFGMAGIRERLATLYGSRAGLELAAIDPAVDAEGGMLATLRLPLPAGPGTT